MEKEAEKLQPGDHAAFIYRTRAEQFSFVAPFIKSGLARGERCLYITNDNSIAVVLERLAKFGIDVSAVLASAQLMITTKKDTYQKYGGFEPEKMVGDLKVELTKALGSGFTGLRATGEMTWALDDPEALSRLVEYEAILHTRFAPCLTGLCQYDETRFSPSILSDIIRIHPVIVAKGQCIRNSFVVSPEQVLRGLMPPVSVSALFP